MSLFQAGRKRGWGYVVIKSKDRISPDFRRATRVAFGCGCPAEQLAIMEISKMTITYFYFFDVFLDISKFGLSLEEKMLAVDRLVEQVNDKTN